MMSEIPMRTHVQCRPVGPGGKYKTFVFPIPAAFIKQGFINDGEEVELVIRRKVQKEAPLTHEMQGKSSLVKRAQVVHDSGTFANGESYAHVQLVLVSERVP